MPKLWIPALLRDAVGSDETLDLPGNTVGEMLEALEVRYPGTTKRLMQGDRLRPGLAIVVGSRFAPSGLLEPVIPSDEVHVIPAIAGGGH